MVVRLHRLPKRVVVLAAGKEVRRVAQVEHDNLQPVHDLLTFHSAVARCREEHENFIGGGGQDS